MATVAVTGEVASHSLAGLLHGLDGVALTRPFVTVRAGARTGRQGVIRRELPPGDVVELDGYACTSGLRTALDLAAVLTDARWEQALECALHRGLVAIDDIEDALPELGRTRTPGVSRIRRALALRPPSAPPTESLLETLMVQLLRRAGLPTPERQVNVSDHRGRFVARVDLAWTALGVFVELDGQHHLGQPVHDARREAAVVATTGWLPGRFTWDEVTRVPESTARRVRQLLEAAQSLRARAG